MKGIDVIKELGNSITQGINSCLIGTIESYNADEMSCNVQPMNRDLPKLINVPISFTFGGGFFIRTPFKKGDMVVVVFSDEDIDNILLGEANTPNTDRMHDLSDGIVIGGITTFDNSLPDENIEDLLISDKDNIGKYVITKDGDVEIEGSNITISNENNTASISMGSNGTIDIKANKVNFIRSGG